MKEYLEHNSMDEYCYENLNSVTSAKSVYEYIVRNHLIRHPHTLKLITLSEDNFALEELEWAIDVAVRSFNNLLERQFTKTAIRESLRTLKKSSSPQSYNKKIKGWLWSCHGRLVKDLIPGGWRKTEVEPSSVNYDLYNVHVHVLCECKYIPQPLLSMLWKSAVTKEWQGRRCDAQGIVHVQDVGNTDEDIKRVVNYIAKPIHILRTERFKNLRLYSTFGGWYNAN